MLSNLIKEKLSNIPHEYVWDYISLVKKQAILDGMNEEDFLSIFNNTDQAYIKYAKYSWSLNNIDYRDPISTICRNKMENIIEKDIQCCGMKPNYLNQIDYNYIANLIITTKKEEHFEMLPQNMRYLQYLSEDDLIYFVNKGIINSAILTGAIFSGHFKKYSVKIKKLLVEYSNSFGWCDSFHDILNVVPGLYFCETEYNDAYKFYYEKDSKLNLISTKWISYYADMRKLS